MPPFLPRMIRVLPSRLFFRAAYRTGFTPWDSGIPPPELIALIEGPRALPAGEAIDLGCGTGTNCRYLLEQGWRVTGVDFVPSAIAKARLKAPGANLIVGDVTRLADVGVSGPFDLLLDLGCFHSLPSARRDAYVSESGRVARPGATLLLFAFGDRGIAGPAAPEEEIRERFGKLFRVVEVIPGAAFRRQTWYRLERDPGGTAAGFDRGSGPS